MSARQAIVVGLAWLALAGPARSIVFAQTSQPAILVRPPAAPASQPAILVRPPAAQASQPVSPISQPAPPARPPSPPPSRPVARTSRPAALTSPPVAQASRPVPQTSRPAPQTSWPAPQTSRPVAQPNIILILADNMAGGMAGFEGHPLIRTANLNQLAAEGVRFTHCYVPTPQSAPTRASILTGRYPHLHGVTTDGPALSPRAFTFTAELKKNGYACGIVGEWDLPCAAAREPGFGLVDYVATDDVDEKNEETLPWQGCSVWVQGIRQTANQYLTDWHGDRAIEFIEKSQNRPFFLWLSFRAPHEPLAYPPGTETLYPLEAIDLPATVRMDPGAWRNRFNQAEPVMAFQPQTEQTLRRVRAQYYAMITRMDENVGRVLRRLDELKLRDNTVVVFTSSNGLALGEHRLYGQGPFFYEELVHVPLLVRCPALAPSPLKIDRVVSLVDLAPTICELAGLPPEQLGVQGTSLAALIRYPETNQHADERFFEYDEQKGKKYPVRGLVTGRYKLIDYLQGDDVFYDLALDPKETDNAISVAEYATMVNVLRNRLEFWRKQTKDLLTK